jgi:hypothetical protein
MPDTTNILIMRAQWLSYMKVGETWELIGEGFTSLTESKNPKEYSRQYVNETSERTDVTGYSPSLAYSCDTYSGDPVVNEIVRITDGEFIGSAAQRDILSVNLWKPGSTTGTYEAFRRTYAIIPDSKGDGLDALIYSGNMKAVGQQESGSFALDTKAFTADTAA